ncbi:MAG: serine/threonine protein kinase [Planctomycetota bacterium]
MDASRYARVRDLFQAAEDLPADQQEAFVRKASGDDEDLVTEVMSLLAEHDSDSAISEGNRASRLPEVLKSGPSESPSNRSTKTVGGTLDVDRPVAVSDTQVSAQRTHAVPRYTDDRPQSHRSDPSSQSPGNWPGHSPQRKRLHLGWLFLLFVLPTTMIGWLTYRQVDDVLEESIRGELTGLAASLSLTTDQFLRDRGQLVESWSRQPAIRQAISDLVAISDEDDAVSRLRSATQTDQIASQLRELSGVEDIKFVVWNRLGITISSWLDDRADVGNEIALGGRTDLARVMGGETVLFGPARLVDTTQGFVPETEAPVMAMIVPVRNDDGNVIAAMLVRGFGMYASFSQVFSKAAQSQSIDIYAISRRGVMLTESPLGSRLAAEKRLELPGDELAARLRVTDPGTTISVDGQDDIDRDVLPLTRAAARVAAGQSATLLESYRNYAGLPVVGAWRWLPQWQMGIVVEHQASQIYRAGRIVRFGFAGLAGLLTFGALVSASVFTRQSNRVQLATHPLSRYEVIDQLGSGGMGIVYHVRHRKLGRDAALKVLRSDRSHHEDKKRFEREARLSASLNSPHSVAVYDYGVSPDGESYCVMQFLRGLTLAEVVARGGHQPFGRVLCILRQICDSIHEAHGKGLVHRDLKPQNVMLSHDVTLGDHTIVFDFGLAKPLEADSDIFQTAETVWAGTPMYMAPERYRAPTVNDPRSDLYSIGGIAYFLLSGHPPFAECDPESMFALILSDPPISIATHRDEPVPDELNRLVFRLMAKNIAERYGSAQELAADLDGLIALYPWTPEAARRWWTIHGGH